MDVAEVITKELMDIGKMLSDTTPFREPDEEFKGFDELFRLDPHCIMPRYDIAIKMTRSLDHRTISFTGTLILGKESHSLGPVVMTELELEDVYNTQMKIARHVFSNLLRQAADMVAAKALASSAPLNLPPMTGKIGATGEMI